MSMFMVIVTLCALIGTASAQPGIALSAAIEPLIQKSQVSNLLSTQMNVQSVAPVGPQIPRSPDPRKQEHCGLACVLVRKL